MRRGGSPTLDVLAARPHYVYRLRDPRDGTVRYYGVSSNLKLRRQNHLAASVHRTWRWVHELRLLGLVPIFEAISEGMPRAVAFNWERRLVTMTAQRCPGQLFNGLYKHPKSKV